MRRLDAADPAREAVPPSEATEALLARILSDISHEHDVRDASAARRRRRGLVVVLAVALMFALAAAALAAVGVIRLGSAAPSSPLLENPRSGIGALAPGTARLLAVGTGDPAGGLPWGMRVLSTTRGVGCIEVGRLLGHRLGVLGQDGAFDDDARFHELPVGALDNGGQCANLDANGLLLLNVSAGAVPQSGWLGRGSCVSQPPAGTSRTPTPPTGFCPQSQLRDLYYGLLGPDATSLTYTLDGQPHTITPIGPEGAYVIVTPHRPTRGAERPYLLAGAVASVMPRPWSSPVTSIRYRNGMVCRIADTQPGTLKGQCTPPGYKPARAPALTSTEVASPVHAQLMHTRGRGSGFTIRVSFTARVAIDNASSSYELVEDTSSPEAVFVATQRDISPGQTVAWLLPAPRPGVYSGQIVLGQRGAAPFPIYTYSAGPLVGRFSIRVP